MLNVILTIHMIACVALVIAVMLQRSEGGALGMSGGGTGGIISGRGAAGVLVRTTMILAGIFFTTSIVMTRINNEAAQAPSTLEREATETTDPFDALRNTPAQPAPGATPAAPAQAAPAPAAPDPLAPAAPAESTAPSAAPATTPSAPAPATTAPTTSAPTPESGGSNN